MKNKASALLKQIASVLGSLIKAKSLALKGKTNAMKARIIIFGLLRDKRVPLPAIFHKIHALLGHHEKRSASEDIGIRDDCDKAIVVYNSMANEPPPIPCLTMTLVHCNSNDGNNDDDKYPDLTHSLFDEFEFDDGSGSVIDLVRNSRENGSEFNLEDEIDHVADVFIRRFHKQMLMQKQESFNRYKEMLDRSV